MSVSSDDFDSHALELNDDAVKAEEMIRKLSALIMADEDFRNLSKVQDVYCPFEALRVEKAEIRHSNFLANILSPNNPHGFGDSILRKFCETLLIAAQKPELALDLHLSDLSNVDIRREWEDIDLLIIFPQMCNGRDLVIAIELKVEAKESKGQLEKYERKLEKIWPQENKILFFVTPKETEASRKSWFSVGFENIIAAIEDSIQEIKGHPNAMMMVDSYINMIRREYMSDPELERLAEKIWSKHSEALKYLIKNQPLPLEAIISDLQSDEFLEQINSGLEKKKCAARLVYKDRKNKRYIRFSVKEWEQYCDIRKEDRPDSIEQFIDLQIDISLSKCSAGLILIPGELQFREKIYGVLKDKSVLLNRKRDDLSAKWTTLDSKTIRDQSAMKKILGQHDENESENFRQAREKFKQDIAEYFIKVVPRFHEAISKAAEEGLIK